MNRVTSFVGMIRTIACFITHFDTPLHYSLTRTHNNIILDIIHCPTLYLKTRFGDWILSPSSSGTCSDGSNGIDTLSLEVDTVPFLGGPIWLRST
jgi:hypothetical protein